MRVSVLIATYNRSLLLRRALASVLRQDYPHIAVTVIDDCSTDDTKEVVHSFRDERVRYVRNDKNVGSEAGDVAIIKRFLTEFCDGEAFVYLCDDDYWRTPDLISRQVAAMQQYPSLAFVQGGMAHCYPTPFPELPAPNEPYLRYSFVDKAQTQMFWGGLYPNGFNPSRQFMRLFAQDLKNRNIVIGATMFRSAKFKASGIMDRIQGVRWQAGPAIILGAAVHGDVFYMDEPALMVEVRKTTASHSGTQADNFIECLDSIDTAFAGTHYDELRDIRAVAMRSALQAFLCNKIANRAGKFEKHALGDISDIMKREISAAEFFGEMERRGVPLSADQKQLIEWSDQLRGQDMKDVTWWRGVRAMASDVGSYHHQAA